MILAISNHKGGVGKTTTTINLGMGLSSEGKRCLLVDLDPQANLTQSLNIKNEITIYDGLLGRKKLEPIEYISNLDVIPSTLDLSGAELELSAEAGRDIILKELLRPLKKRYSHVLIDCPPSLGLLTLNALVACDRVIVPMQTQFLAFQGLAKLVEVVGKVKSRLNKKLEIGGIVLTQFDERRILDKEAVDAIERTYQGKVFRSKIRANVKLAEAPSVGKDIFSYAPTSHGAEDYREFSREVSQLIQ